MYKKPIIPGITPCNIPEVSLQDPVQVLPKWPGGEVAGPVVVVTVGIREEIS